MSAPSVLITFWGATTLPSDFDILRPFSSTVNPWVRTPLYGARAYTASLMSSELWNQPRCWSEPSRYSSTGAWISGRWAPTHSKERPESAQTSITSFTFSYWSASAPRSSAGSSANQASMPPFSTRAATASISSCVRGCSSPVLLCTKSAIGTPHVRWRDTHQSGRFSIMPVMRCSPHAGVHFTCLMSRSAFARRPFWSMLMNHWGVARKMTGVLCRQQCG
jgi:hypothetical protein